jgi:glutathione S-transferase
MEPTLYYMPFSPWSHKARCALRHHHLTPRGHAYVSLVEEPRLRWKLRQWRGRVTVPVLFTSERVITESWDIALWAERNGSGSALIPNDKRAEISEWNAVSDRLLSAARSRAMLRALEQPLVLLEVLPAPLAKLLGERGARMSTRLFNAKYAIDPSERAQYELVIREELQRVQRALHDGRRYLTGELSYADIAVGVSLMVLGPLPGEEEVGIQKLGFEPELSAEFPSLRAWRNAVHAVEPLLPEVPPPPSAAEHAAASNVPA